MINRALYILSFLLIGGQYTMSQVNVELVARTISYHQLSNGDSVRTFGFAEDLFTYPTLPGPTLYANEGDSVTIDLWNMSQGAPHTIHLHGLDVDQENDGVPHLSFEVHHQEHGYYRFKAPHPGTYLYHCHVVSPIHVQAGMFGLVIIKPSDGSNTTWDGGYPYDRDISFVFSEIDSNWHKNNVLNHAYDTTVPVPQVPIPEYHPQFYLVNGLSDQMIEDTSGVISAVGAQDFIRLTNIGFYGNRVILPSTLNAQIISSDGRPLPSAISSDTVELFPGERFGLLINPNQEFIDSIEVEYIDMNTGNIANTQYIPVLIDGTQGISDQVESAFSIYPNPCNDYIVINGQFPERSLNYFIFDIHGRKVHEGSFNTTAQPTRIEFGDWLNTGTYFIAIQSEGKYFIEKFIKK